MVCYFHLLSLTLTFPHFKVTTGSPPAASPTSIGLSTWYNHTSIYRGEQPLTAWKYTCSTTLKASPPQPLLALAPELHPQSPYPYPPSSPATDFTHHSAHPRSLSSCVIPPSCPVAGKANISDLNS
ncbi:hypothetical protein EDB19DRAFT_503290 [Suillus lakei]|nr:hypothetical protein EDB19DRAFT_503290 [Suillus lakei]